MELAEAVRRLMDAYPKIFFACHQRHRKDPETDERLSAHQGSILDHLDELDGTGVSELARHMGVTPSTMSLNVDRLARRGYVERRRDADDGRRVLLFLTPAGVRIKRAQSVLEPERVRALLRPLTDERIRAGIEGLETLADAALASMAAYAGAHPEARLP